MGYAVAVEARRRGAEVLLISGPTSLAAPEGVHRLEVETADVMRKAVLSHAPQQDVIVMSAAVADYRPVMPSSEKLRREDAHQIEVTSTPDIAAEAAHAAPHALHIGFALESSSLVSAAREKLRRKGQDLVVANGITAEHNPFGSDLNQVVFVTETGERALPLTTKTEVARLLWDEVVRLLDER
jgi:phosphopantothenoylcysteine decarboxylase/phosphopantothenate--cysteine ligase